MGPVWDQASPHMFECGNECHLFIDCNTQGPLFPQLMVSHYTPMLAPRYGTSSNSETASTLR